MLVKDIRVGMLVTKILTAPDRALAMSNLIEKLKELKPRDLPTAKLFFASHPAAFQLTREERKQIQEL